MHGFPFLLRAAVGGLFLLLVVASQVFWIQRVRKKALSQIQNAVWRKLLGWTALAAYLLLFANALGWLGRGVSPTHLTLKALLLEAPFAWWFFGSTLGFVAVLLFLAATRLFRLAAWAARKLAPASPTVPAGASGWTLRAGQSNRPALPSPARRRFLERTALAVGAVPFAAGAYGMIFERVDLETTRQRIRLARLPRAFDGFRIAQLSDLHIGPFMSEAEIRRVVGITNQLKADLIVLTGDYVTWDPSTQGAVVNVLAGLKAPRGVFGCLGNHELWTSTQASITRLFAAAGVPILRQERVSIAAGDSGSPADDESLNLVGVDFQTHTSTGRRERGFVRQYLAGVDRLLRPDSVNILLSHNPNTFDRAAELGIDLSLAGHTHGGQVSLEFVHPGISPSRLITSYLRGWFQKGNAQLYVNRGIGTIGVPIRIDAPPEITVFELVRA
ncbi:MAG: metallophosphoesterase [Terriglobia bacterium]